MTPAARVAAAIEILDRIRAGAPGEQVLTGWARSNRYAGSGDRAAIRDHVFDVLRRRRSSAFLGGGDSGRALMIGLLRGQGIDPNPLFSGEKFAPAPLNGAERDLPALSDLAAAPRGVRLDCPDGLLPDFDRVLGPDADAVLAALRDRAPVFLRVNVARTDRTGAAAALAAEGIDTRPSALADTALEVLSNPRRVARAAAYRDGLVELQDAASQAVVAALGVEQGERLLDYCAGGGGKALALAALGAQVAAHDANPARMKTLPERARRAGASIEPLATDRLGGRRFDMVFCDAPCSGSGAWRRTPAGKWDLSAQRRRDLARVQAEILRDASRLVADGGRLAYATCSFFRDENEGRIEAFLSAHGGWHVLRQQRFSPLDCGGAGGDGFFVAILQRENVA